MHAHPRKKETSLAERVGGKTDKIAGIRLPPDLKANHERPCSSK